MRIFMPDNETIPRPISGNIPCRSRIASFTPLMSKFHIRWLDPRTGSPREFRLSPLWFVIPAVLVLLQGWILVRILRSSQSPEKLLQKTEQLRRSNDRLEQHLNMVERNRNGIETKLASLESKASTSDENAVDDDGVYDAAELVDGGAVDSLLARARHLREAVDRATGGFEKHASDMIHLPTINPVRRNWPEVESFGSRLDPFTSQKWIQQGCVFGTPVGTPVWATGAGTVVDVSTLPRWGLIVEVDHGNGFQTIYGHLASSNVQNGQSVLRGQLLGLSGNSGKTTAPQAFYAVFYHRKALDPHAVMLPRPRLQPSFLDSTLFKVAEIATRTGSTESKMPQNPSNAGHP
jgi:murein DD-endopeptidase MepM/ murein hydrolase activator NlpD